MYNCVDSNMYYNNYGEPIPFGSLIKMSFAGSPIGMTTPYTLVSAENFFSTVGYKNEVTLLVRGANGGEHSFSFARYYSPKVLKDVDRSN